MCFQLMEHISVWHNKGYFTRDDIVFTMLMLPNERWTYNEAEHLLNQWCQEGKLEEIELERSTGLQKEVALKGQDNYYHRNKKISKEYENHNVLQECQECQSKRRFT